ncbi:glycogen synthase GlgA [Chitinimonas viridis]|uniref:Glycogen synthase n=1 Tax=Chitinimonas viridis TaxID=664880 RepID=A0ABT8B2R6_9NEIS|nr:glycogen synthase GlgA [Chitinimonas viridis]MDN3576519.1 glycogen synthase GlgA [Chitinimonas viridis]
MKVLHVAAECYPLLKTGGLADVVGALPAAQRQLGLDARIVLPGFPAIRAGLQDAKVQASMPPRLGSGPLTLWQGYLPDGVPAFVIDAPGLYDRVGNPYADAEHHPYTDNHRRFALLGWVAARMAQGLLPDWRPDVLHGHDWHAGLAAAYLKQTTPAPDMADAACVFTIHNLAYQGLFPASLFAELGLPAQCYAMDGMEFHGQLSFIKAGLYYSDRLATVSPSYAAEIQTAEHGCGLEGLLRHRRAALSGILNGVDEALWNPATDPTLPGHFDADKTGGKARCKTALQAELGLVAEPTGLLFCVVSRLTEQKGLNLVLAGAEALLAQGGQLAVLGSGEPELEAGFSELLGRYPGRVAVRLGFDEPLSHRLFAGSDVVLLPSRFEPCGLTQMYGMRYGALPLARRTGGLADSVRDCSLENLQDASATGMLFERFEQADFDAAVRRAFALYAKPQAWREVRRHAMQQHFGWAGPAKAYQALYRAALKQVA